MSSIPTARVTRALLVCAGTLSVALGIVGIFIPILPTTPFLLLAALCYDRSSAHCHRWLLHNRWFGSYIRNYREGRGMPRLQKVLTLIALWLTIGSTVVGALTAWWGRLGLIAVACAVTVHLLRIRTFRPETQDTAIPANPLQAGEVDQIQSCDPVRDSLPVTRSAGPASDQWLRCAWPATLRRWWPR